MHDARCLMVCAVVAVRAQRSFGFGKQVLRTKEHNHVSHRTCTLFGTDYKVLCCWVNDYCHHIFWRVLVRLSATTIL